MEEVMRRAALIGIVVLFGCRNPWTHEPHEMERMQPSSGKRAASGDGKVYFQLSPPDQTTAADNVVIAIWAEVPGQVPMSYLTDVAAKVSLVTYPEGTPIAWTANFHIASSSRDRDSHSKVIVLPQVPLVPRWYALKVAKLPDTMGLRAMTDSVDTSSTGETMVRFRYGSEPRVVMIDEFYEKEDQEFPYLIEVALSETMATGNAVSAITLNGPIPSVCQPAPTYGTLASTVSFRCRSSAINDLSIAVAPFAAVGGASVQAAGALATIHVDPTKVVVLDNGVKHYGIRL
jgi:hypothetical protein